MYAAAVIYRAIVYDVAPGYPTFAGFSAILAVWLDYYSFVRSRFWLRLGVIAAVFASVALNLTIITRLILEGRSVPLGRSAFTLLFLILLYDKTRDVLAHRAKFKGLPHEE